MYKYIKNKVDINTGQPYLKSMKDLDIGDRYDEINSTTRKLETCEIKEKYTNDEGFLFIRVLRSVV